jgi:subfamily B ATP-binding cassette protein MsbA
MQEFIRAFLMAKGQWVRRGLTFIGVILDSLTIVYTPWVYKTVFDSLSSGSIDAPEKIVWGLWTMLAIGLLRFGIVKMEIYFQDATSYHIGYNLRRSLLNKLLRLPFSFFDQKKTGDLMSVLVKDVQAVQDGTGFGVLLFSIDTILLVSTLTIMFKISTRLSLAVLFLALPVIGLLIIYNRKVLPKHEALQKLSGDLHSVAQESISGVRVVKSFVREDYEQQRFNKVNDQVYNSNMELVRLNSFFYPSLDFINTAIILMVLIIGGREIILGRMTIGGLMAFTSYSTTVYWVTREVAWLTEIVQQTVAGAKRIFAIVDSKEHDQSLTGLASKTKGHIVFDQVDFGYDEDQKILEDFSLEIKPGETVALLGLTGSGKSTVANLLARFYEPTKGKIMLDGKSLSSWQLKSLRDNIGFVFQDNFLFSETVKQNILLGSKIKEETLDECLQVAQADRFIKALPLGKETILGERGVGLSGGEKQRVSIARALVRDPQIIIFDDASSSLDLRTEKELHMELGRFFGKRTVLLITQRVSTAKTADRIVVLENGHITEIGSHQELLKNQGLYAKLHNLQEEVHTIGS